MGLSGFKVIKRFELVDLFKAEKVFEERWEGSVFLLVISIFFIAMGYFLAMINNARIFF